MEYLITYPGADITILNNDGDTALHIVCRYFHVGALEAMLCNVNSFEQAAKYCLIAFQLLDGMIYLYPDTRPLLFMCDHALPRERTLIYLYCQVAPR